MDFIIDNSINEYKIGLTGVDEIIQNVKVILNTRKGSVPLDRDFGVDWSIIDKPTPASLNLLKVDIVETVEKYEPRVKVKEVNLIESEYISDGILRVLLKVEINIS